jgi:hypothetical protein
MKNNAIILIFILLFLGTRVSSQPSEKPNKWCESALSNQQKNWLDYYQRNDALFRFKSKNNSTIYIPIKAHIVGKDDGTGYYSIDKLLIDICELNQRFEKDSTRFHFFLYEDIDYINNTSFYNDASTNNPMAKALMSSKSHHTNNALNIFFIEASPGLCGYYYAPSDVIALIGACGGSGSTTLTHEIGHYFSLPHTFDATIIALCEPTPLSFHNPSGLEKMDGSNCHAVADKFCDTPPDYSQNRYTCSSVVNNCTMLDPNRVAIHPDSTLYMGNADDICQNRFSNEQVGAMQASLDTFHHNFKLNLPQNSIAITSTPTISLPINNSTYPCDFVPIHWNKIAGAEKYLVAVYLQGNSSNQVWSRITTDTFTSLLASDNIAPNLNHFVKVMAFNSGNSCNSFGTPIQFSTSKALGINDVT